MKCYRMPAISCLKHISGEHIDIVKNVVETHAPTSLTEGDVVKTLRRRG